VIPARCRQQPNDVAACERTVTRQCSRLRTKPGSPPAKRAGSSGQAIRLANRQLAASRVSRATNDAVDEGDVASCQLWWQLGRRCTRKSERGTRGVVGVPIERPLQDGVGDEVANRIRQQRIRQRVVDQAERASET
jgi:hypothetical protein